MDASKVQTKLDAEINAFGERSDAEDASIVGAKHRKRSLLEVTHQEGGMS